MAVFRSPRFPWLRVADLGLRFQDGVLEVSEAAQVKRLRGLTAFGVVEDESSQPEQPEQPDAGIPVKPKRGRPRKSE